MQLMAEYFEANEELMPHRCSMNTAAANSQAAGQLGAVCCKLLPEGEDARGDESGSRQPRRCLIFRQKKEIDGQFRLYVAAPLT